MKKKILIILWLFSSLFVFAQKGGRNTYAFLGLGAPARVAALGGDFVSIADNDVAVAFSNASLITPEISNQLILNYISYFSGINYGYTAYARDFEKIGSFLGGIQFAQYGTFEETDEVGNVIGSFSASDYSIQLGWGRTIDSIFRIGAQFKTILSFMGAYNSVGIAVDVSASYVHPEKRFSATLWLNNMGTQVKAYANEGLERLPFEIAAGFSQKFKHAPFRFNLQLRDLERWDLSYDDPANNLNPLNPEEGAKDNKFEEFADNAMRHVVMGMEFLPFKALSLQMGYNYGRRQEMKTVSRTAMVGFSWGVGLHFSKFDIGYARSTYHLYGSPNFITLTLNLNEF